MIAIMRGAVKGAGNPKKLQLVVRCADPPAVYEVILDRYSFASHNKVGRRGGETHLLLAKAMGFLDYRNVITIDAGKTFLVLSDIMDVPKEFLLMQLLRKDRTFLIPFLSVFSEAEDRTIVMATEYVDCVLEDLWKKYPDELNALGFERDQHKTEFALAHFINPRLALLKQIGVNDAETQRRLAKEFDHYVDCPLPDNSYFLLANAVHKKQPTNFISEKMILGAYSTLKGISYASIVGLYDYLNQMTIPRTVINYDKLFDFLRGSGKFNLHPLETLREGMFRVKVSA